MKKNILKIALIGVITLTSIEFYAINANAESLIAINHDDEKADSFKVYGNCGMCEKTIEGALKDVKGIDKADWNKETKMMEVVYHTHHISLEQIKKKIAEVGYDTEEFRSTDKTYKGLPGCCQYERPESK